jgi:hypothetical protein
MAAPNTAVDRAAHHFLDTLFHVVIEFSFRDIAAPG